MSSTSFAAPPRHRGVLLALALFVVALNLRAALAVLPPLVGTIQSELGIGSASAGLLTTVPVLCMGLFAPAAQRLAAGIGRERTVGVALALLLAGQLLRLGGARLAVLLAGTFLVGLGIALAGTVLPGIVKEYFAARSGAVTGGYLVAMMVGAAGASALAVPVSEATSWQISLTVWAGPAVVGLLAWLPVVRRARPAPRPPRSARVRLPWRNRTAWVLAAYLSLQSWGFYSQIAWIAPSYESWGWSARDAGLLLSLWSITQLVSAVAGPALADRVRDRRPLVAVAVTFTIAGLVGVVLAPTTAPALWIVLLALGQGGGFAFGLVKLVDYAPSPTASARLSALVFLVSYSVASLGPFVFGAVHDATDGYAAPFTVLLGVAVVQLTLVPQLRPGRLSEPAG